MDFSKINLEAILIGLPLFIIAGSIHEFAHGFSAYILGDNTAKNYGRLTINPIAHIDIFGTILFPIISSLTGLRIIGWMKPVPTNPMNFYNPSKGQAITAFAGPFSNFLQASFALLILKIYIMLIATPFAGTMMLNFNNNNIDVLQFISKIIYTFAQINMTLMIFNLLPFPPLDGGWILRHFLSDNLKEKFDKFYSYGIFILFALSFFGLFSFLFIPLSILEIYIYMGIYLNTLYSYIFFIIPVIFGILVIYFFMRKDIKEFIQRSKKKEEFINNIKETEKKIIETISDNSISTEKGIEIINKLKNNTDLTLDDHNFIDRLKKNIKNTNLKLCDYVDFEINDNHCIGCDNYPECMLREIESAQEKKT